MKALILRIVASPAVRKALLALVLAILAAAGVSLGGCGGSSVPPELARARAVFECQHAVLESVVSREDATNLLQSAEARDVEAVARKLLALGLTPARVRQAVKEIHDCAALPSSADAGAGGAGGAGGSGGGAGAPNAAE